MSKNFHNKSGQSAASLSADQAQALAQTLLQQASAFHQKGQLTEAQALYESLLRIQPRHFDGLRSFGALAYQMNRYQMAIELMSKAIGVNPKFASLYLNIGLSFQALHRFDDALANYDQAIALAPNIVETHNNRGDTLRNLHRLNDALVSYDKAIALKPNFAQAYGGRGIVLAELKQFDDALVSYDQAIALKPDFAEAHNNRGVTLKQLNRLNEALVSLGRAIALKPYYPEAHYNYGDALQDLERLDEALVNYDKAIALKPYYPEAYYNRGNVLHGLNRLDEALISYDKAIALKPDYTKAHDNRGNALQKLNHLNATPNIDFITATNAIMEHAPSSSQITKAATPTRTYTIPIRPGFERHYADYQYAPNQFADKNIIAIDGREVRVVEWVAEPEIVIFENLLSDVECELLIELSRPKLQRSGTYDRENPDNKGKVSTERTSEGTGFLRGENALIRAIETRLAKLMNMPYENGEETQILHYVTGAEYRPHYDFFPPEEPHSAASVQESGQRVATLIMYLNDVESGGETIFPEIDFAVAPRKGGAVYFSYFDNRGILDRLTLHGGAPVTRGEKWIATKWVRQRGWRVGK